MSLAVGLLLFLALAALAYANGANDVSKGVATLVGSGTSRYRQALVWGTAWTAAGSLAAGIFSRALIDTFSKGIIGPHHQMSGTFLLAALIGAIIWVLLATWTGLPVSTTHAITGALCGAALAAFGWRGVLWTSLEHKVVFPLLFSPLVSLAGLWLLFPALRAALGPLDSKCACAEARLPVRSALTGIAVGDAALPAVRVVIDHVDNCRARTTTIAGIEIGDGLHWISSGLTSFARGLNDAPKIAALGVVPALTLGRDTTLLFILVALAMVFGSLKTGRRVTETLAEKITPMSTVEGLSANLVTGFLVAFASHWGLPVSTTHVSAAAIMGIGLRRNERVVRWKTVWSMLQAWVITLPACAALGGASWWILETILRSEM